MSDRISVAKTYKLYIGGAFPRSESGRSYPVNDSRGGFLANAAQGSRKDARDAVAAARKAFAGWSGATAYNRGQVMVDAAIDRWVWYAGWTDKIASVFGAANPVAGPYFSFSVPEPTGVVAVLAPQSSSLLGLVSVVAPVIAAGNTCVVVASQDRPLPAITLSEVLATSDVPGGVVNVLTGRTAEIAPWLAAHADVNALDLTGAPDAIKTDLERAAAGTVKRLVRSGRGEPDWVREPDVSRMRAVLETKTVWHPMGV
jgi:acyl-CoA reductase-like NAD-dependent aldehyde dehydrogenase